MIEDGGYLACWPDAYDEGYQSNGIGGGYGTGDNAGRGWQSNGIGGYYGTGENAGHSCQPNGIGGVNCY